MDKRIGAQYYTIRDFIQNAEDFDKSCERIAKIGYKTVQLSGLGDIAPKEIKKILDKHSLEAICSHRPSAEYENDIDKVIEWHKITGCKIAGLGAMPGTNAKDETISAFLKKYNPVSEKLYDAGLTFAYHNHAFEFEKKNGRYAFDVIAENTNPDKLKFILDVYWLAYAGINPAEFIEKYKDRVAVVHFKDIAIYDNEVHMSEIGQGNIDWDSIIAACEKANVGYAFVEQDVCRRNPFDCLETSYNYLKTKGFN